MKVCWITEPSVVASSRLSLTDVTLDVTNRDAFDPQRFVVRPEEQLGFRSMGTVNGSIS